MMAGDTPTDAGAADTASGGTPQRLEDYLDAATRTTMQHRLDKLASERDASSWAANSIRC